MPHVVLLGDSIFDNGAYTGDGPDVITQLRAILPKGWQASLLAIDGSTASGLAAQAARIPAGATHLVVSAGGNDALGHSSLLVAPARSAAEVLDRLSDAAAEFEAEIEPRVPGQMRSRRLLAAHSPSASGTSRRTSSSSSMPTMSG